MASIKEEDPNDAYDSTDSEKEEYVDSGLPPPSPYMRRDSRAGFGTAGSPSPGIPNRAVMNRVSSMPSIASAASFSGSLNEISFRKKVHTHQSAGASEEPEQLGGNLGTGTSASADIFAERKKKLQSAVMTQSMPEIRDIRSLYNKGIGKSMRSRSNSSSKPPPSPPLAFDSDVFDTLLADM